MKPQVPEGLRVEYSYFETRTTPNGRLLARPHRGVQAVLVEDTVDLWGFPVAIVRGVGVAVAKEGPLADQDRHCRICYDQFSRKIGRDIALGRAVANYYTTREREAEVAA